jgi:diguanylate cyclase (GGDEF)-like protein
MSVTVTIRHDGWGHTLKHSASHCRFGVETISVEFKVACADREEGGNVRLNCSSSWRSAAIINGLHSPVSRGARWLVLLSAMLCLASQAKADLDPTQPISQYIHQAWQDDQGLPQNNIMAITHSRDGYLWVGTEEGLARFDGIHFVVFDSRNTPGLTNNTITALLEDRDRNLWIGTQYGLFRMTRGVIAAYPLPEALSGKTVSAFYQDQQGSLWIATDGGGVGRLLNGQITVYTISSGLASDSVFSISAGPGGSVWFGTASGLNQWKNGQFTTYTTRNGLPNDDVRALCQDAHGGVWIGTRGGLSLFRNGTFSRLDKKIALSTDSVQALYEDRNQTLWAGTLSGGLVRLRDGKAATYATKDGLSADDIMSISGDEAGNLWVATGTAGLNRFSQGKVTSYTMKEGLPSDTILGTYQDRDGNLWIGTADRGLSLFRDGKFTNYSTRQGLSSDTVFSIVEDFEHNVWIGTRKGLDRFKDGRFRTYTARDGLAGDMIGTTLVARDGTLWAGGRGGLSRLQNGRFTAFAAKEGLSSLLVTALLEDRTGALWVGTDGGINRFKDGRFESFTIRNSDLSNDHVMSLYEDSEGALWIGTEGGGLYRLKNGKFTAYGTRQGMFDDRVLQILDPGDGNLWMSSNRGIFYVKKQQLNDFADGKIRSIGYGLLGTEDGMKTKECNGGFQPAGWTTREGRLVFPTMKGIVIIDPKRLDSDSFISPTVLESVTVDKKPVPVDATAVSPPGHGDLEFQFTAPNFTSPRKVRFQYQLEGYDRDWVDAIGPRIAHYTNIPAGTYRFRVRAGDEKGSWNGEGVVFNLVLKPHFYRTYWFYVLCGLVALALGAAVLRVRLMSLKARQQQLSLLVDQRTAELQSEILVRRRTEEDLEEARDEAIRAHDQLHFQANHDALTGIWNRGAILDLLNREIERSGRSRSTIGILMLDVDHFKKINDTHGHPAGDVVLREVALRITQAVRLYDSVGRYGGEEFLVVLPGCDESQTSQSAERIRSAIAEGVFSAAAADMVVTISIGATVLSPGTVSTMEILALADKALYQAKARGRNQTALDTPRSSAEVSARSMIESFQ